MSNLLPEPGTIISSDTKAIVSAILSVANHIVDTNKKVEILNKKLDELIRRTY